MAIQLVGKPFQEATVLRTADAFEKATPHRDRRPGPRLTGVLPMEADYVVVGAGSAGCVVAARLSETGARGDPARGRAARYGIRDPHSGRHALAAAQSAGQLELHRPSASRRLRRAHALIGRAARCSAAPARSTGCSMCAATRPISMAGRRWAAAAGATTTCCRTSASPRHYVQGGDPEVRGQGGPLQGRGLPHHPAADPPLRRSRAAGRLSVHPTSTARSGRASAIRR